MKKLLLTLLIIPSLSYGEEWSVPEYECALISSEDSRLRNECQDKYFGQEFDNLSHIDRYRKILDCAYSRYNKEVCKSKDYRKMLKEDEQKFFKAKAIRDKEIEGLCLEESDKANNDFTAKKIFERCMKREEKANPVTW